jgi:arylsulfatase A-like enzyme
MISPSKLTRRSFSFGLPAVALSALALSATSRPNIVFVLVDDLRFDELGCTGHPFAQTPHADRLAREGALFTNAFSVVPLCSPSRASFLTGRYPHANGITDNTDRSAQSQELTTWPRLLHDSGYETAFIGKWHMGNSDAARPGFDHWVSFPGQGECIDPVLNVNGQRARTKGYITDLLSGHAAEFLRKPRSKPFCLYLAHKAVHPNVQQRDDGSVVGGVVDSAENFIPATRHKDLYAGAKLPRRKNFGVVPIDKPALQQTIEGVAPLGPGTATEDATILNRMRMAKAIDEGLGQMMEVLEQSGQLDQTVIVFTSDHGYFYGEHCLGPERRLAYEEAIRIPLLIRYPAVFRAGSKPQGFALSVDLAPTMLDLAGVKAPPSAANALHGVSLRKPTRRDAFLIEYFSDTVFPRIRKMGYRAVRTARWKYIQYQDRSGSDELYDLSTDPFELKNRIGDTASQPIRNKLQARLAQLMVQNQ